MKLKVCSSCKKETYLWKSKPPLCKPCAMKMKGKYSEGKKVAPAGSTGLYAKIKPIADKRAKELAIYRTKRDQFLKDNPVCQFPGCFSREVTCHHAKGRIGKLVYDDRYFVSLCLAHHREIEENPGMAKKLKLSENRLDK